MALPGDDVLALPVLFAVFACVIVDLYVNIAIDVYPLAAHRHPVVRFMAWLKLRLFASEINPLQAFIPGFVTTFPVIAGGGCEAVFVSLIGDGVYSFFGTEFFIKPLRNFPVEKPLFRFLYGRL